MANEFRPDQQAIIHARSKADESEVIDDFDRRGFRWEQLDLPTNTRKRPEGSAWLDPTTPVLVEVKRAESGGKSSDGKVMLSDLDPDLTGAGIKCFPAIPSSVERQLDHARDKYVETIADDPRFVRAPYVVAYYANVYVSLDLIDRRMPGRREISALAYVVRDRARKEFLESLPLEEQSRRIDARDESGVPPGGQLEWRIVPNPYARHPLPPKFKAGCLIGWPGEVSWPESMTKDDEDRARAIFAALSQNERVVLEAAYWLYGRLDASERAFAPARPVLDSLVAKGLAVTIGASTYELTTEGLRVGLVRDLDK